MVRKNLPSPNCAYSMATLSMSNSRFVVAAIFPILCFCGFAGASTTTFFGHQHINYLRELIAEQFGISRMTLTFDFTEVAQQASQFSGDRPFDDAVIAAFTSILSDGNDSESPLSLASIICVDHVQRHVCARQLLERIIDQPETKIILVSRDHNGHASGAFPPERGERLEDNWIFCLSLPSLSDHIFWAIVPRDSLKMAYTYGFN